MNKEDEMATYLAQKLIKVFNVTEDDIENEIDFYTVLSEELYDDARYDAFYQLYDFLEHKGIGGITTPGMFNDIIYKQFVK